MPFKPKSIPKNILVALRKFKYQKWLFNRRFVSKYYFTIDILTMFIKK